MWPSRHTLDGTPLGDAWPCPSLAASLPSSIDQEGSLRERERESFVPFHKLTQWLTWSLIALFERSEEDGGLGCVVVGKEDMTGLPEYRNGQSSPYSSSPPSSHSFTDALQADSSLISVF